MLTSFCDNFDTDNFGVKVNHGRMREEEARKYFQQLINTVDYCHSRGVYHRDLKVSIVAVVALNKLISNLFVRVSISVTSIVPFFLRI